MHNLQGEKFKKIHVIGEQTKNKQRNTVCSTLSGQYVKKIRKSGTFKEMMGTNEGEQLYVTVTPVKHMDNGKIDSTITGENPIVFLGVSDGPNVTGIHMKGPGDLEEDSHVLIMKTFFLK